MPNQQPDKQSDKQSDKQPGKTKIKAAKKMRDLMTIYYIEAMEATQNNKKVAWITSGGPVEPLVAMDIIPVYPENHGAMIGSSKMGDDLCIKAEDMGYSSDLCSYARADISCSVVKGGPIGGLPKPDMLICCNNICGTVLKWYEVQARFYNVPLFIFDTPVCHTGYSPEIAKYVRAQIGEYIAFLEKVTKRKLNPDKMAEVGRLSHEGQRLWRKVLDLTTHKPSPMSAFDAFFFLALIVTLRGTKVPVDFYKDLINEMEQRINDGISIVPNEKHRLLWDNLPVWYQLKWLSKKFSDHNACLVADTYTSAWCSALNYIDEIFNKTLRIDELQTQNEKITKILLYPVPASDKLNLEFNMHSAQNIKLSIYNSLGRKLLFADNYYCPLGKNKIEINIHTLAAGLYFLNIYGDSVNKSRIFEIK